jgi:hypothetical protein
MWQPTRAQWSLIWIAAVTAVLTWPPPAGRSLAAKMVNWAVDPRHALPLFPEPLPMALDDDGNAVAEHDALERAYYDAYSRSRWNRWRMEMKEAGDPFDPTTTRQTLVGLGVIAALMLWRMEAGRNRKSA